MIDTDDDRLLVELDEAAETVERLVHSDPPAAEALALSTLRAAANRRLPSLEARVSYSYARLRAERGELDEALALISRARLLWEQEGEGVAAARTDLGTMQILDDLGRHGEALAVGDRLLTRLSDLGADPRTAVLLAAAHGNIGVAQSFLGRHDESLHSYEESERRYAELELTLNVAQQRANRGIELLALGRAREAEVVLVSSEEEFRAEGDRLWAAKCAAHLADAHRQAGAVVAALRSLDRARAELEELGAGAEVARVQVQLGRAQLEAGMVPEAVESSQQALLLCERSALAHDAAFARLVLASAHLRSGSLAEAEREAVASVEEFARFGDAQYRARAALVRAQVAAAAHDPRAEVLLDEAATLLEEGGWTVPLAWALLAKLDRADHAGGALLERVSSLVDQLGIPSLTHARDVRRALALSSRDLLDDAVAVLEATVADIEAGGRDHPDPLLRVAALSEATAAHDLLVDLLVRRGRAGDAAAALQISEAASTQALGDLLAAQGHRSPAGWGARAEDPEQGALLSDLSAAYTALSTTPPAQVPALLARARSLEARLGTGRLRAALARPATPPTQGSSRAVRPLAPCLAHHVCGDDIIAFVVGADGDVTAHRSPGARPRVASLLDQLATQWRRFELGAVFARRHAETLEQTTRAVLGGLYAELVAPVRALLDRLPERRLTVVPHRLLHRVPFAALHDGEHYLLETWTLDSSPVVPRAAAGPAAGPVAVATDGALVLAVSDLRAPQIAAEAERLRTLLPGSRVLTDDAAVTAALAGPLPGLVHLACHGLHRPDNPAFSALRLADRWLTCADLLDLDLSGTLLTMSACESAGAAQTMAEPLGLAWAALAAGASGVVVSQWVLDDAMAVELVDRFYRGLVAGSEPASALREAQRAVARTHRHPYYWAPLVLISLPTPPEETRHDANH